MNMRNLFLTLAFGLCSGIFAQNTTVFESPIMGWSSWNTYRVHINDTLIIRQADAMVQTSRKVRPETSSFIRSDLSKGKVAGKFQFAIEPEGR